MADATKHGFFTFDGTFQDITDDFFITSIGGFAQTPTQFWGLLDNYTFTQVSGCEWEVKNGDQVLWAYDAFNKAHFLKLTGAKFAHKGQPYTVTVTDGSTGLPISGAQVDTPTGSVLTDVNGHATLTYTTRGFHEAKAQKDDSIRSNALTTWVLNF